jgi:hypothetical protein
MALCAALAPRFARLHWLQCSQCGHAVELTARGEAARQDHEWRTGKPCGAMCDGCLFRMFMEAQEA